ncbi:MAG: Cobalt/magnesium transport protein CorA [bacterium]|nr:Cobalt/magnesium transport protein CorA [bacterium]
MAYGPSTVEEAELGSIHEIKAIRGKHPVTWISVQGLGDVATLRAIADLLDLHPLALEDVVNVHQRAKADYYENRLFLVARVAFLGEELESEQVSFFLGEDFVLSFQEGDRDGLEVIRERIRQGRGRVRNQGADYLAYCLLDAIVDGYYRPLEAFGERLEALEDEVLARPTRKAVTEIHRIKRDLLNLRRVVWPLREMTNDLLRDPIPLITPDTRLYLKDCYDHVVQIIDLLETDREVGSDLMDAYLTASSNKMNEIMKVLAIITTVFMPMSLVAGIYGMNFDPAKSPWNMPELLWHWGYPFALGLMAAVGIGLLALFRWRGWLEPLAPLSGKE